MFALASEILGGRRLVLCADGETRMARIPGRCVVANGCEGDLIILWPWDFQDSKADVKHRYADAGNVPLPKGFFRDVDMFGMGVSLEGTGA